MKIYVSNIPSLVNKQTVFEIVSEYGIVKDVKIIKDKDTGKSRGFCFVEMPNENDAHTAITNLNNYIIDGRKLKVDQAHAKKQSKKKEDSDLNSLKSRSILAMKDDFILSEIEG